MKRTYAAMMLGLALSVTSINVFAEETEAVQTEEAGTTDAAEAAEPTAVWGEVTSTEEGSITINNAELQGAEETPDTADDMVDDTAEADDCTAF